MKFNWSKIAKGALQVGKRKVELMEAEMKAPGRECRTCSMPENGLFLDNLDVCLTESRLILHRWIISCWMASSFA